MQTVRGQQYSFSTDERMFLWKFIYIYAYPKVYQRMYRQLPLAFNNGKCSLAAVIRNHGRILWALK